MASLRWISVIAHVLGLVFIFYGWTQSWDFSAHTSEYESILIARTVRTYAFIIGGFILLFVGVSLKLVCDYLRTLENEVLSLDNDERKSI
ncbi:hypothetical protein [Aquisalibacillus elongatus]|uniref:Uncharacterized protein n=1 Tax=Aquisalibacillus elongatus TaxID=485577 RepID=A0A3N5B0M2_9BACI|nr:hypothetical protein [Aquisalibacillus elongatus]RPF51116.1 hypothetical protein EDC24_2383 [Aquisalibacillus elongatus]